MGDEFCKIGVREPQKAANEAFCEFGEYHRFVKDDRIMNILRIRTKIMFRVSSQGNPRQNKSDFSSLQRRI